MPIITIPTVLLAHSESFLTFSTFLLLTCNLNISHTVW